MKRMLSKQIAVFILTVIMVVSMLPMGLLANNEQENNFIENAQVGFPATVSGVPADFENDLWLQYDHKALSIGQEATIYPNRVPQIITDSINNDVARPDFTFEIVTGGSISIDKPIGDSATVTAIKDGTTIVKVSYNEKLYKGITFGACSPVNYAYVVYTVGETSTIEVSTDIKYSSYDTVYFKDGESVDLPFSVTAADAKTLEVTCNGKSLTKAADNQYIAPLENRSNVIGIVATDNEGKTKSLYKIVDARKIEIVVKNKIYPGAEIAVGHTAEISFKGITHPVYKMATIYNPTWYSASGMWDPSEGTYVHYKDGKLDKDGKASIVVGRCDQWDLSTNNTMTIKFSSAGTINFSKGGIFTSWWGKELGTDKSATGTGAPGLGDPYTTGEFSKMPDFSITVLESSNVIPVTGVSFDKQEITLIKGQTLQLNALVMPEDATNKGVKWNSSSSHLIGIDQNGLLTASDVGETTITATTIDGDKIATCKVTVEEGPATDEQKQPLLKMIEEAKALEVPAEISQQWTELQKSIVTAQKVADKNGVLPSEIDTAKTDLDDAMKNYNRLNMFKHTVEQKKVENGTEITVKFPVMEIPNDKWGSGSDSWKTIYSSNIPDLSVVATENLKDNKDGLRTLKFVVPSNIKGSFELKDGYLEEKYIEFMPPRPQTVTQKHYYGKMPSILIKIEDEGNITPPVPQKTVTISVDKLIINKGYVLETTKVNLLEGDTAWDVSKRIMDSKNIPYQFVNNAQYNSVYVKSIAGDGEFDHGSGSGWMYSVNGKYPLVGCNRYTLSDGDTISWRYTKNYGQDVGGGNSTGGGNDTSGNGTSGNGTGGNGTSGNGTGGNGTSGNGAGGNSTGGNGTGTNGTGGTTTPGGITTETIKPQFSDVSSTDWYYQAVQYVTKQGLFKGTNDKKFNPSGDMTRAMLVTVLYNLAERPTVTRESNFKDANKLSWYYDGLIWAESNKIVSGYSKDIFGADDSITREQIAKILYNYATVEKYDVTATTKLDKYTDNKNVSTYAADAMKWAVANGIISGRTPTTLAPKALASRAEVATMLMNFVTKAKKILRGNW